MTAALTPALALAYLDELSLDVQAVVVLGREGEVLAGEETLAPRVRELLAPSPVAATTAAPAAAVRIASATDGCLVAARGAGGAAIGALARPSALLPLLGHDLAQIADALVVPSADAR